MTPRTAHHPDHGREPAYIERVARAGYPSADVRSPSEPHPTPDRV